MAELHPDPRLGVGVDEVDDPPPGRHLAGLPETRAPRRDPSGRRHAEHLAHHEPRATERSRAEVDEVEVLNVAVDRRVHVHGRHDDAVRQLELAKPERHEHRRTRGGAAIEAEAGLDIAREPLVDAVDEALVAHAEVVVGDAAAAREEVEDELPLVLVEVLLEILEPLLARCCGALRARDERPARLLVGSQCRTDGRLVAESRHQRRRILDGELRRRADREVRGVRGIAEQGDVAVVPALDSHRREAEPLRVVAEQPVAVEQVAEHLGHDRDALPVAVPGRCAVSAKRSKPSWRQTSVRISTMNVDSFSSYG